MPRLVAFILLIVPVSCFGQLEDEIRMSIFFGGGSYYIDEDQATKLHEWLDSIPNLLEKYEIQLISHTDPIGGKEYNARLSRMRSEAVQRLLVSRHIPKDRISIKDWGLENPVYSNDTYSGMVSNRRVDVILYPIIF